jgi:hypothetical protein
MGIGVLHCHCSNARTAEVYTGGKIFARAIGRSEAGNFKSRMAASIVNGDGKALGPPVAPPRQARNSSRGAIIARANVAFRAERAH